MRSAFALLASAALIVALLLAFALPLVAQTLPLPSPEILDKLDTALDLVYAEEPLVSDAFSRDRGDWTPDGQEGVAWSYAGRALHAAVAPGVAPAANIAANTAGVQLRDLFAEVDVAHEAAGADAAGAMAGIVFRYVDADTYYAFGLAADGRALLLSREAGATQTLLELPPSEMAVAGDERSRLGVLARQGMLVLLVNDEVVATYDSLPQTAGDAGLFVTGAPDQEANLLFDDFELWDLAPLADTLAALVPAPEPAPKPTTAPALPAVDGALLDAIRSEDPLVSASFTRPDDSLLTTADDGVTRTFAHRTYHMAAGEAGVAGVSLLQAAEAAYLGDLLLEVSAAQWEGTPGNRYGVVFRCADAANCYRFLVNGRGEYALAVGAGGEWQTLVDWTPADALLHFEGGASAAAEDWTNRLGVLARGDQIVLLANDEVLATVTDATYAAGGVGLAFTSREEGGAEVVFDDLEVWALAGTELASAPQPTSEPTAEPAPTEESTEEPTAEPAPAPAAGEALLAAIDGLRATEPLYRDEFAKSLDLWMTAERDFSSTAITDGGLHVKLAGGNTGDAALALMTMGDFLLEVDAQQVAGKGDYAINLIYRMTAERDLYLFQVRGDGVYNLSKAVGGEPSVLLGPAPAASFDTAPDAVNRLGILAKGPQMAFLINGEVVAQVEDDAVAEGMFGLGASTEGGEGIEVVFDNLVVWDAAALEWPAGGGPQPTAQAQPAETAEPTAEPTGVPAGEPTAEPTVEPTAEPVPTEAPEPAAVPEPTAGPLTPASLNIDWSAFEPDFHISNVRITEGTLNGEPAQLVVFDVEAVADAGLPIFTVDFWNAKGDWITGSVVELEPAADSVDRIDFIGQWLSGAYGRGMFALPSNTGNIAKTVLVRLN